MFNLYKLQNTSYIFTNFVENPFPLYQSLDNSPFETFSILIIIITTGLILLCAASWQESTQDTEPKLVVGHSEPPKTDKPKRVFNLAYFYAGRNRTEKNTMLVDNDNKYTTPLELKALYPHRKVLKEPYIKAPRIARLGINMSESLLHFSPYTPIKDEKFRGLLGVWVPLPDNFSDHDFRSHGLPVAVHNGKMFILKG